MNLRELGLNLRQHNWGATVTEVLVVVLGIFLGLQVDDWYQSRTDRIDELEFLVHLHDDLLVADELSRRVRQRRLDRVEWALDAADVLFSRNDRSTLTANECEAIVLSTAINIVAPTLPSVDELIGTGRLGIVRDTELRTALVRLRQSRMALDATIAEKSTSSNFHNLTGAFPELFRLEVSFDDSVGEIRTSNVCNLEAMRVNTHFLNQFSVNVDSYDAYLRDGLKPWISELDRVHVLVDDMLVIDHSIEEGR